MVTCNEIGGKSNIPTMTFYCLAEDDTFYFTNNGNFIPNGSKLIEMDTAKTYLFAYESAAATADPETIRESPSTYFSWYDQGEAGSKRS